MGATRKTRRQKAVMRAVIAAATRGSWLDIDELIEAVGHTGSKPAMQSTIRFLEEAGLVKREYVTRRERVRMLVVPTSAGFAAYAPPGIAGVSGTGSPASRGIGGTPFARSWRSDPDILEELLELSLEPLAEP